MRLPRTLPLAALLTLAFLAGAAQAQMPSAAFQLAITTPQAPVAPGNGTDVTITLTRVCPTPGVVLDQQSVDIAIVASGDAVLSGPGQILFGQQTCATQASMDATAQYRVHVPRDSTDSLVQFVVKAHPRATSPASPGSPEQQASFTVAVAQPVVQPDGSADAGASGRQELPGLGGVAALVAIGAVAVALRRRT